jgi:hypothetical protein
VKDLSSHLSQFVKFVEVVEGSGYMSTMKDFYDVTKLTGFLHFMDLRKLSPNTVSNKCKSLVRVSVFFLLMTIV